MSEKKQITSESIRGKMLNRYGDDGLHHKHDKNHRPYRLHFRSHPCLQTNHFQELTLEKNISTGLTREFKLRKIRKRFESRKIH